MRTARSSMTLLLNHNDDDDDPDLALSDTKTDSIQYLNFAQNWFNSIFNSKLYHENSIQKFIQFKIVSWKFNSKYYSIWNDLFWFDSIDYSIRK